LKKLFEFENIQCKDIDLKDERFKISNETNNKVLEHSISQFGIMTPPLLLKKKGGFCVISGFRRIKASLQHGALQIEACVTDMADEMMCAQIAVMDNSFQRSLSVSEQIRSVTLLSTYFSDPENNNEFFKAVSESLLIPNNKLYIKKLWQASHLSESLMDLVAHERISLEVAVDLSLFDLETQKMFHPFFLEFKISLSKQKEFVLFIREIAAREKLMARAVLEDVSRMVSTHRDLQDKNAIFGMIRNCLYQRRYPEITVAYNKHNDLVSRLKFPDTIKFMVPESFEGSTYQIQFNFKTMTELKQLNKKIEHISNQPEMEMILKRE